MLRPGITLDNFLERQRGTLPDTYGVRPLALSGTHEHGNDRRALDDGAQRLPARRQPGHAGRHLRRLRHRGAPARRRQGLHHLELKSNFLGTAREGVLSVEAIADHMGRSTQIWSANVVDATGRKLALFRCSQVILW